MATLCAKGKHDFTMLVGDEEFVQVTKKCICTMFGFLLGSIHASEDVVYGNNNVVISSI
jgi:hypothetical protein